MGEGGFGLKGRRSARLDIVVRGEGCVFDILGIRTSTGRKGKELDDNGMMNIKDDET